MSRAHVRITRSESALRDAWEREEADARRHAALRRLSESSAAASARDADAAAVRRIADGAAAPPPIAPSLPRVGVAAARAARAAAPPQRAFAEVVRTQRARAALQGQTCPECDAFYRVMADAFGKDPALLVQRHSRHRHEHAPPSTPPGFWDVWSLPPDSPVRSQHKGNQVMQRVAERRRREAAEARAELAGRTEEVAADEADEADEPLPPTELEDEMLPPTDPPAFQKQEQEKEEDRAESPDILATQPTGVCVTAVEQPQARTLEEAEARYVDALRLLQQRGASDGAAGHGLSELCAGVYRLRLAMKMRDS